MKASALLSSPFLLVALVVVSWAAAAPLQDDPEDEDMKDELEAFLEQNPSIAQDLYPELLEEASEVTLKVDQDIVKELLSDYIRTSTVEEVEEELEREAESEEEEEEDPACRRKRETVEFGEEEEEDDARIKRETIEAGEEEEEDDSRIKRETIEAGEEEEEDDARIKRQAIESVEEEEEDHARMKRQTSLSGSLHGSSNPYGRSIGGSVGLSHSWNNGRHSLSGNVGGTRHTVKGLGSANSYSAGVGYNFSPNKKTSFGISAHKSVSPGGSSHGFGLNFSHKFGR